MPADLMQHEPSYAFRYHGEKQYTRNREDYRGLCPPCHNESDVRERNGSP